MVYRAGRELDAFLAQQMGLKPRKSGYWDRYYNSQLDDWCLPGVDRVAPLPRYSADIAAAWPLLETLPVYVEIARTPEGHYLAKLDPKGAGSIAIAAPTGPLLLCAAKLQTLGVDVEIEGVAIDPARPAP